MVIRPTLALRNRAAVPVIGPEPVPVAEHRVVVDGTPTRYWVWGDPQASTTVVAIHGFRGDHHGLLQIVARLRGCRVITPDLPGFGRSAPFGRPDAVHDVEHYAQWLRSFCTTASASAPRGGEEELILLGHSFGSVISSAAVAAGLAPDRLVLINPIAAPALQGPRAVMSRVAVGYYRVGAALPERIGTPLLASRAVVRLVSQLMVTTKDRRLRSWIHDQHHRYFSGYADRRVVLESFTASVSHDVSEYAAAITMPTLLIAGDRDDIVPVAAQYRLADRIDGSRLEVLSGVGHLIHYERAAAAAELIMGFIGTDARA